MGWRNAARPVVRRARAVGTVLRRPPWVAPGHYYSPLASVADVARAKANASRAELLGFDLRAGEQRDLIKQMIPLWDDYLANGSGRRFQPGNMLYSRTEAAPFDAMLRLRRPKSIIEVGSGYSTAVALDTRDAALPDLCITCIEPYPDRLLGLLRPGDHEQLVLRREPVQDTPLDVFDALQPNDILFIDSTHVSKPGSDVNWLLFEVLPRLRVGVLVHVHDIFWPFEYPTEWLDEGRDWNENYLLRAFLTLNDRFAVRLFLDFVWKTMPDVAARFPGEYTPSGLWLERVA
ncbi:MAG TPA: class I SAM-dependent methyltransferase [Actinophytocola sp.]|jgi:predicted O-methyltransferase YrrM|uniref:class I SAM-dependent methyltransferase n=1 Tax=Actinophytocola sp. TaxID=1872138 RepID=UPI002DFF4CDB|nr:class I SAM-dependent methyltransferase [Actinophytocola sp.]